MTRPGLFLKGRLLYLVLLAVVGVAYGWLFARSLRHAVEAPPPAPPAKQVQPETPSPSPWRTELDRDKVVSTLRRRPRLAMLMGLWSAIAVGLGATGLLLSWSLATKRRLPAIFNGPPAAALPAWKLGELVRMVILVIFLLALLPFVHISLTAWASPQFADERFWSLIAMLVLEGWFIVVLWGFAAGRSVSLPALMGISRRGAGRAVQQGLTGYAMVFPWVFGLLWVVVRVCQRIGLEPPAEEIHKLLFEPQGPLVLGLTLALACFVGPVVEELFFRGVVFAALRSRVSRWLAIVVSGILFALLHTNIVGFLPIMALGCVLAALYARTGSLLAPIAVHIAHNTFLVGLGLTVKELL